MGLGKPGEFVDPERSCALPKTRQGFPQVGENGGAIIAIATR